MATDRPPTVTVSAVPGNAARVTGSVHTETLPPAQLTVRMPSSSESRLSIVRPWSTKASSASAPRTTTVLLIDCEHYLERRMRNVVRVQNGKRHRNGDAVVPAEGRAARADRVAVYEEVKPFAVRSFVQSGAVSQTMSMCPCRMTGAAAS